MVKQVYTRDLKSLGAIHAGSSPASRTNIMKTYIVDIDNTVLKTPGSDYHNAEAIVDRIVKVNRLYRDGNKVIYWTARGGSSGKDWHEFTKKQLHHYGCEYTEFRSDKPHYDVWIDDKAINSEDYFKL